VGGFDRRDISASRRLRNLRRAMWCDEPVSSRVSSYLEIRHPLSSFHCRRSTLWHQPPCRKWDVKATAAAWPGFLLRDATQSAVLSWQVVRLSVSLAVTLRYYGHTRWNTSKVISRLISAKSLLSADTDVTDRLQRKHPKMELGNEKVAVENLREQNCNSPKWAQDRTKVTS